MPYERARRPAAPTYSQMKSGVFTGFTPVVIQNVPTHSSPAVGVCAVQAGGSNANCQAATSATACTDASTAGNACVFTVDTTASTAYTVDSSMATTFEFTDPLSAGTNYVLYYMAMTYDNYNDANNVANQVLPHIMGMIEFTTTGGTAGSSGGYCSAGMYQLEGTGCVNCGKGKFTTTQGSQSCTDCTAGKYMDIEGSTGPCASCMKGKFSSAISV